MPAEHVGERRGANGKHAMIGTSPFIPAPNRLMKTAQQNEATNASATPDPLITRGASCARLTGGSMSQIPPNTNTSPPHNPQADLFVEKEHAEEGGRAG